MLISKVRLKNWRNFAEVDVDLGDRMFIVGPNAVGKSNFLDAIRFLRDVSAEKGGGLQHAVVFERGGLKKIRCLAARRASDIEIEVDLATAPDSVFEWRYFLSIHQEKGGKLRPAVKAERAWHQSEQKLDRPNAQDLRDIARTTQTYLEQISANAEFRDIAVFLQQIQYFHLVPQVVRRPDVFSKVVLPNDPYGQAFLLDIARAKENTRKSRLLKIQNALQSVVPFFDNLDSVRDRDGVPHLEALYKHWRPHGAKQQEDQFSDGTLRLIGLLWALLDGSGPLLLEEPELSLHVAIIRRLPALIHRMQKHNKRQVIITTHSADLLSDKGIGTDEVLMLLPGEEGTGAIKASSQKDVIDLVEGGMSVGEAVLPRVAPRNANQLAMLL